MKRKIQTIASGAEVRVRFPPGFKTPLHTHDAEGRRNVVKGRLRVEDDATNSGSWAGGFILGNRFPNDDRKYWR